MSDDLHGVMRALATTARCAAADTGCHLAHAEAVATVTGLAHQKPLHRAADEARRLVRGAQPMRQVLSSAPFATAFCRDRARAVVRAASAAQPYSVTRRAEEDVARCVEHIIGQASGFDDAAAAPARTLASVVTEAAHTTRRRLGAAVFMQHGRDVLDATLRRMLPVAAPAIAAPAQPPAESTSARSAAETHKVSNPFRAIGAIDEADKAGDDMAVLGTAAAASYAAADFASVVPATDWTTTFITIGNHAAGL